MGAIRNLQDMLLSSECKPPWGPHVPFAVPLTFKLKRLITNIKIIWRAGTPTWCAVIPESFISTVNMEQTIALRRMCLETANFREVQKLNQPADMRKAATCC